MANDRYPPLCVGDEVPLKLRYSVASDPGRVRKNNEDAFLADPAVGIFAVADGMGGHAAGEIASRVALNTLQEALVKGSQSKEAEFSPNQTAVLSPPSSLLVSGIRSANLAVFQSSTEKEEYRGMGTTLVAVYFGDSNPAVAHVGDSRLYRIRSRKIEQFTEDHSVVWEKYREGLLPKEALSASPLKNIVTRALGMNPTVDVDVQELEVQKGDQLLLCSDGLSDLVRDDELLQTVEEVSGELDQGCRRLVQMANQRGGKDNITVLLIKIE
jgi:serine/threonine protein phosphatase PrpC